VTCDNILLFCTLPQAATQHLQFSRRGKRAFELLKHNEGLRNRLTIFNSADSNADDIASAGEAFLLLLYGAKDTDTLDSYRYFMYKKTIARQNIQSKFDMAELPPTCASSR
jgi:hypothetical protein